MLEAWNDQRRKECTGRGEAALERRPQPSQEAQMEEQPACSKSLHPSKSQQQDRCAVQARDPATQNARGYYHQLPPSREHSLQVHPVDNSGHRPRTVLMVSPVYLVTLYKVIGQSTG